jgi:uncharacterized protein YwqG
VALILDNQLLDLGTVGLLAVTAESDHAPLLAHEACDAAWIDARLQIHDRRDLFAIGIDAVALRAGIAEVSSRMQRAVASVAGQQRWLGERAQADDLRLFPCQVVAVGEGRVLAIYAAPGIEPSLRYIDVVAGEELWTLSELELRDAWNVPARESWMAVAMSGTLGRPRITAAGRYEVCVAVDLHTFLFRPEQGPAAATQRDTKQAHADICYAGPWRIERMGAHDSAEFLATRLDVAAPTKVLTSKRPGWIFHPFGAADADLVAFSHGGGLIAIQSLAGPSQELRPFPKLARDAQVHVDFERQGSYFLARFGYGIVVADREQLRCAAVNFYPHLDQQLDRDRFDAKVLHRAALCLRDDALLMVRDDQFIPCPLEQLQWQPMPDLSDRPAKSTAARPKPIDHVDQLAASLRLPQVDAVFAKPQASITTSVLGDHGLLPEAFVPMHDDVPMAMLCQIDLGSLAERMGDANPYPREGALLVFVSIDGGGELAEGEEMGSPAALEVVLLDGDVPAVEIQPRRSDSPALQALSLGAVRWTLPDVDSVHVDAVLKNPEDIERYRKLFDGKRDDDEDSPAIRIGGYPEPLQGNDLELEAAHQAKFRFDRETSPQEWRLLMQLESDEFMWGTDSGCLYLMIHRDDLAAGDFSQVVWIAQGY